MNVKNTGKYLDILKRNQKLSKTFEESQSLKCLGAGNSQRAYSVPSGKLYNRKG
jgi:hypothetical protein